MRTIARKTLREFWIQRTHTDAEQQLKSWFRQASNANWASPAEIEAVYPSTSVVGDSGIVFNIAGNKYRLVVKVNFPCRVLYIRFVGTHRQHDEIDLTKV
jgi:mRNA interferase HigB